MSTAPDAPEGRAPIAIGLVGALVLLVALKLWQGQGYWEYSDGVYSCSARAILDGFVPYRDFAAAQPPPVFYIGALALGVSDTPSAIRVAMAGVEVITSLLVLTAVWRLTLHRATAVAAGLIALVTPAALREHAQLLPETLAAPAILGAALAASRPRGAIVAGALGAFATACKLALALPALAVVLCARQRWRALAWLAGVGAAFGLISLAIFGSDLIDNVVTAQRESGGAVLHDVAGLWAQAGWTLLPLLALAGFAFWRRDAARDSALVVTLAGASIGSLLLLGTLLKHGSSLTVLVAIEPPLLCLAALGARAAWVSPRWRAVACALVALSAAQVGSLLVSPDDPAFYTRPFAASGGERIASPDAVETAVVALQSCRVENATIAPYYAFVAHAGMAGNQPDQFLIRMPSMTRFAERAAKAATPTEDC